MNWFNKITGTNLDVLHSLLDGTFSAKYVKDQIETSKLNLKKNRQEVTFEIQLLLQLIRIINHCVALNSREQRIKNRKSKRFQVPAFRRFFSRRFSPLPCPRLTASFFELEFPKLNCCGLKKYMVILIFLKERKSSFISLSPNVEESRLFWMETSLCGRRRDKTWKNKHVNSGDHAKSIEWTFPLLTQASREQKDAIKRPLISPTPFQYTVVVFLAFCQRRSSLNRLACEMWPCWENTKPNFFISSQVECSERS